MQNQDKRSLRKRSTRQGCDKIQSSALFVFGKTRACLEK